MHPSVKNNKMTTASLMSFIFFSPYQREDNRSEIPSAPLFSRGFFLFVGHFHYPYKKSNKATRKITYMNLIYSPAFNKYCQQGHHPKNQRSAQSDDCYNHRIRLSRQFYSSSFTLAACYKFTVDNVTPRFIL
jgi:hypothetical protein